MGTRTHRHNRRKYSLKVPIVSVTKYRKRLFKAPVSDCVNKRFTT